MKHYFELLGLFAVSGCLALLINSAALAHPRPQVQPLSLVLPTQVRPAIAPPMDDSQPHP